MKVAEASEPVFACISVEDVDNVLSSIFAILDEDSNDLFVEVVYLGQTIRFHCKLKLLTNYYYY